MYSLGLDVGRDDDTVEWARSGSDGEKVDAWGAVSATVGAGQDGTLRIADGRSPVDHITTGFLTRLGASEPVIVGATPYGAEALLGAVLGDVIRDNTAAHGDAPDAIGLVHADGLDQFRSSLLVEAARVAGIPPERVVLVPKSAAEGAAAELDDLGEAPPGAAGAAAAACAVFSDDDERRAGAAALGAGVAAAVAAAVIGTRVLDGGIATAAGTLAGPVGAPLAAGPAGTPLAAGPGGSALSSGPAGAPITAGPGGTPLGPTGTQLAPGPNGAPLAGPQGSPLTTAARVSRPRWLPAAVVGGAAAVAVVVGVAVVAAQGDDEPPLDDVAVTESAAAEVTGVAEVTEVAEAAESTGERATVTRATAAETVAQSTTTTSEAATTSTLLSFDLAAFAGEWNSECQPFLAGDGASGGRWIFEVTGGTTMDVTLVGVDYTTVDCSDGGEIIVVQGPVVFDVYGMGTVEGREAFLAMSEIYGNVAIATSGDELFFGIGGGGPPSAFEPQLNGTRR